jgi:hypothetical protein
VSSDFAAVHIGEHEHGAAAPEAGLHEARRIDRGERGVEARACIGTQHGERHAAPALDAAGARL